MNIVKISGSTAQQMFQYAFYLELCRHDAHARLDVPQDKWIKYRFKLPHFLVATPEQLAHFGKKWLHESHEVDVLQAQGQCAA